jgi:hypothetical protein
MSYKDLLNLSAQAAHLTPIPGLGPAISVGADPLSESSFTVLIFTVCQVYSTVDQVKVCRVREGLLV